MEQKVDPDGATLNQVEVLTVSSRNYFLSAGCIPIALIESWYIALIEKNLSCLGGLLCIKCTQNTYYQIAENIEVNLNMSILLSAFFFF